MLTVEPVRLASRRESGGASGPQVDALTVTVWTPEAEDRLLSSSTTASRRSKIR